MKQSWCLPGLRGARDFVLATQPQNTTMLLPVQATEKIAMAATMDQSQCDARGVDAVNRVGWIRRVTIALRNQWFPRLFKRQPKFALAMKRNCSRVCRNSRNQRDPDRREAVLAEDFYHEKHQHRRTFATGRVATTGSENSEPDQLGSISATRFRTRRQGGGCLRSSARQVVANGSPSRVPLSKFFFSTIPQAAPLRRGCFFGSYG